MSLFLHETWTLFFEGMYSSLEFGPDNVETPEHGTPCFVEGRANACRTPVTMVVRHG